MLTGLNDEADLQLTDLTAGSDLGSRFCIRGNYSCVCDPCSVLSDSVPSSAEDFLSFPVSFVEVNSMVFIR